MLRIKTVKSDAIQSRAEKGEATAHSDANIWDQHQECRKEIEIMRHEIQRHTRELEMKFEQKLDECIEQMSALRTICVCSDLRDEITNLQTKDETDDVSKSKSPANEETEQPGRQTLNPVCASDKLAAYVHSCDRSDGTEKDDSDLEDSSFIEGRCPTTRTPPFRKGRKRRQRKSHF